MPRDGLPRARIRTLHAVAAVLPALIVLGGGTSPAAHAAGDADRGRREFLRCAACHTATPNAHKLGPSLATIWRRRAGTVDGFANYSAALKGAAIVWDESTLDAWLRDPKTLVPGNRMVMGGIGNARIRRDLIEYLKSIVPKSGE